MRLRRIATIAAQAALFSLVLVAAAGAADPSYAPSGGLPVGRLPSSVAAADVNRDGHVDFVVGNHGSDDLTVLLGNGAGGFNAAAGSPIAVGDGPSGVVAADLNADGITDLAVAHSDSNDVRVLIGDGAGGFAPGYSSRVGGSPAQVAIADLNGDGHVDLALPVWQENWRIAVLLGDGAGRFAPGTACGDRRSSRDDPNRARGPERRCSSGPGGRQQRLESALLQARCRRRSLRRRQDRSGWKCTFSACGRRPEPRRKT